MLCCAHIWTNRTNLSNSTHKIIFDFHFLIENLANFVRSVQVRTQHYVLINIFFAVQTINVTINVGGPVAPNVTLDPNANSVIGGGVSQSTLHSQPNLVSLNPTISTTSNSVLTSTTTSFSLPVPSAVNADVNANVSIDSIWTHHFEEELVPLFCGV